MTSSPGHVSPRAPSRRVARSRCSPNRRHQAQRNPLLAIRKPPTRLLLNSAGQRWTLTSTPRSRVSPRSYRWVCDATSSSSMRPGQCRPLALAVKCTASKPRLEDLTLCKARSPPSQPSTGAQQSRPSTNQPEEAWPSRAAESPWMAPSVSLWLVPD